MPKTGEDPCPAKGEKCTFPLQVSSSYLSSSENVLGVQALFVGSAKSFTDISGTLTHSLKIASEEGRNKFRKILYKRFS